MSARQVTGESAAVVRNRQVRVADRGVDTFVMRLKSVLLRHSAGGQRGLVTAFGNTDVGKGWLFSTN